MSSIGRTDLIGRMRRIETLNGILERLAGLFVEGAEDLLDRAPHRILEPPAGQLLGHRIDVVDGRAGIRRDDAVADRLQGDLRAFLLAEQRLLVELALGDIELDAYQAQQPAVLVHARGGAADDPTPLAVAVAHAVRAFETPASCRRRDRESRPARAPDRPDARGCASRASRACPRPHSRASPSSGARSRPRCSRRRSPTARHSQRTARAWCAPRASRGVSRCGCARGRWRGSCR